MFCLNSVAHYLYWSYTQLSALWYYSLLIYEQTVSSVLLEIAISLRSRAGIQIAGGESHLSTP